MPRSILFLGLFIAALPVLAACSDSEPNSPSPTSQATSVAGDIEIVQSTAARIAAEPSEAQVAARALDQFAIDLYRSLPGNDENLVFSPYSIAIALAMARNGAVGPTLEEMTAVLHAMHGYDESMNALDQALASRAGEYPFGAGETRTLEFASANQLWGHEGFEFHDAFLQALATNYGAGMRIVDFAGDTEGSRQAINGWVSEQTRERIPELIPEGVLNELTRLVLTNAVYLNAPWMMPFDRDQTAPGDFTTLDGSSVQAEMMKAGYKFHFADGPGFQAVELPYVDGSLSMLVIVPDEGGFAQYRDGFDAETLSAIVADLETAQVNLQFPKFKFRTQAALKDVLTALGMPTAFDDQAADFSAMAPTGDDLFISAVIHEAFIAVDEHGTEAAAATAVVVQETSAPPRTVDLTVDRPFLFAIRDRETGATLFLGHVIDPTN